METEGVRCNTHWKCCQITEFCWLIDWQFETPPAFLNGKYAYVFLGGMLIWIFLLFWCQENVSQVVHIYYESLLSIYSSFEIYIIAFVMTRFELKLRTEKKFNHENR